MDEALNHICRNRLYGGTPDYVSRGFASLKEGERIGEGKDTQCASSCCGFADEVEANNRYEDTNKGSNSVRDFNQVDQERHVDDKEVNASDDP